MLIWIVGIILFIIVLRFAFKIGFIVLILGLGFFLGYRYRARESEN